MACALRSGRRRGARPAAGPRRRTSSASSRRLVEPARLHLAPVPPLQVDERGAAPALQRLGERRTRTARARPRASSSRPRTTSRSKRSASTASTGRVSRYPWGEVSIDCRTEQLAQPHHAALEVLLAELGGTSPHTASASWSLLTAAPARRARAASTARSRRPRRASWPSIVSGPRRPTCMSSTVDLSMPCVNRIDTGAVPLRGGGGTPPCQTWVTSGSPRPRRPRSNTMNRYSLSAESPRWWWRSATAGGAGARRSLAPVPASRCRQPGRAGPPGAGRARDHPAGGRLRRTALLPRSSRMERLGLGAAGLPDVPGQAVITGTCG